MFTSENSYSTVLIAVLVASVVATFVALGHALHGFQFFW